MRHGGFGFNLLSKMQWPIIIGLHLGIRSGDWDLRMASIKQMAPIFTAFDHQNYQKLLGRHIADTLCMPSSVLTML